MSQGIVYAIQFEVCVVAVILFLSCRKRILATGGCSLFRMQLPDSTVINEPDSKENSCFSSDTTGIRRSLSVFADCNSEHSDSIIHVAPMSSKKSTNAQVDYEHCDSPSTCTAKKFLNTSTNLDGSDLFFSPRREETSVKNVSRTSATENIQQDEFYGDDFDIDDLNDYDFPNYYEEPPPLSVTLQNPSTIERTIKEGGPTSSQWEKKPTTPPSAAKPSKICSPGKHSRKCVLM